MLQDPANTALIMEKYLFLGAWQYFHQYILSSEPCTVVGDQALNFDNQGENKGETQLQSSSRE